MQAARVRPLNGGLDPTLQLKSVCTPHIIKTQCSQINKNKLSFWTSWVAQMVKNLPAKQETWV